MTTSRVIETGSITETLTVAAEFARSLSPGTVVALHGDLGAGKTTFVKGMAQGLDIQCPVTSPTFTLIHEYPGGTRLLYHADLYRLGSVAEAVNIGIEDYLAPDGITVIEWAEKIEELLPAGTRHVQLETTGETSRRITFT